MVFLQEVQGENTKKSVLHPEWPSTSHFEHLADSVWDHYAYGKNAVYPEGHHGNAILSKYPIIKWQNFDISTNKIEKRGLLNATVKIPDNNIELDCFCLHLNLLKSGRKSQVKKISSIINDQTGASRYILLGGDFNDWSENIMQNFEKEFHFKEAYKTVHKKHPRTFPSKFPVLKLDRIYYKGLTVTSARIYKEWKGISDHLALFAEFKIT